jgi:hypothetical protein
MLELLAATLWAALGALRPQDGEVAWAASHEDLSNRFLNIPLAHAGLGLFEEQGRVKSRL